MASLKEEARNYVPKKLKNISDLEIVPIEIDVLEGEGIGDDEEPYNYKYILWEGEKYRVPETVLDSIKTLITENPSIEFVRVIRKGTTKTDTKYTVVQKSKPVTAPVVNEDPEEVSSTQA